MIHNKKGFTLIEFVIVMAIVGILAITAIVALSSKSMDARNARRISDMAAIISAMGLQCADSNASISCNEAFGNKAILAQCNNPGQYINLGTVMDPTEGGTDINADGCSNARGHGGAPCNYTILDISTLTYDPCDPHISYATESSSDWHTGCATKSGIDDRTGETGIDPATCVTY